MWGRWLVIIAAIIVSVLTLGAWGFLFVVVLGVDIWRSTRR
jgi:hypothetical protein